MFDPVLGQALDFDAAALAANQQGLLTDSQRQALQAKYQSKQRGGYQVALAFLTFFPCLMFGSMVYQYADSGKSFDDFLATDVRIFGFVMVMLTGLVGFSMVFGFFVSADARRGKLSMIEGRAKPFIGEGYSKGRYFRYELTIQHGLFRKRLFRFTNEAPVRAFQADRIYRVYYVKYYPLDVVLSAEPVN